MTPERRAHPRERIAMPVRLGDGRTAVTSNLSSEGMYLLVRGPGPMARWLTFELPMVQPNLAFTASAEVLRVEPQPGGITGIAVRLHAPRLEADD